MGIFGVYQVGGYEWMRSLNPPPPVLLELGTPGLLLSHMSHFVPLSLINVHALHSHLSTVRDPPPPVLLELGTPGLSLPSRA
jgi:hypothetical protein